MSGKLAVCVPTYQNPNNIHSLIKNELPKYVELGIDLYIMDSSFDDLTEKLVHHEQEKCQSLFYMRFNSDIPSNIKVFKAYQMAGKEIPCDYIWVRSDILFAHNRLLESLVRILANDYYDFLVTNPQGRFPEDILEVNDRQELFENYAWILTMYGAAIVNVKRMLCLADWNYLEERYLSSDRINYSHVCFYFELLNAISKPRILVLNTQILYRYMHYKTAAWEKLTLPITLIIWPNAIYSLPDNYRKKDKVIHSLLDGGFYEYEFLELLASKKILTQEIVDQYRDLIEKHTSTSIEDVYAIANGAHLYKPDKKAYDYEPLLEFARKYKKIVVYGSGKRGKRYAGYLIENGIKFEAFLVTHAADDKIVLNHPVIQADKYEFTDDTGIVIGMRPEYQIEIYEFMRERKTLDRVFSYPYSFEDLQRFLKKLKSFANPQALNRKE